MEEKGHLTERRKCGEWEGRESGGVLGSRGRGQLEHLEVAPPPPPQPREASSVTRPGEGKGEGGLHKLTKEGLFGAGQSTAAGSPGLAGSHSPCSSPMASRLQGDRERSGAEAGLPVPPPTSSPLCRMPMDSSLGLGNASPVCSPRSTH